MKTCEFCDKQTVARGLCFAHYMRGRRSGSLKVLGKQTPQEYIKARCIVSDSGCWIWTKSTEHGYGRMMRYGKAYGAHVYSYLAFVGEISDGLQINHKCHNRACVNPDHLYAGTQKQNIHDMNVAGRRNQVRGVLSGNSKIDDDIAMSIFRHVGPARIAAKKYGVSISLVYAIRKKIIWRHIHEQ